ncbi:hypothetical protein BOTNAR_0089g00360 [Botryotinia narcissicola]|uniref:N-acetyltransferase domain-containing protein n=1 Tax=Botryotinia narcissicola TaxID=278944 RepID=A0A4Z1J656_9HELO|nr:hypothetical protein BOTNAR_0089g00360 [Botryotinia narcissicola]
MRLTIVKLEVNLKFISIQQHNHQSTAVASSSNALKMDPPPAPQNPTFVTNITPHLRHLDLIWNSECRYVRFRITCDTSDSGTISIMEGHLVNRALAERVGFERTMGNIDTECSLTMASVIFDEYGQLQQKWFFGTRKGSGIWDARINIGNFLMINFVEVEEQYRRRGFAKYMVSAFLSRIRGFRIGISYVFTYLGELDGAARRDAIAFWRAMGFKRVGLSHVFCFAMSMDDKSKMPDAEIEEAERDIYDSEASYSTEYEFSSPAKSDEDEQLPQSHTLGELNELDEPQRPPSDKGDASEHSNSPSPAIDEGTPVVELFSPNVQSSHTSVEEPNMSMENSTGNSCQGDDNEDSEDLFHSSPSEDSGSRFRGCCGLPLWFNGT